jgi:hypothetical protein
MGFSFCGLEMLVDDSLILEPRCIISIPKESKFIGNVGLNWKCGYSNSINLVPGYHYIHFDNFDSFEKNLVYGDIYRDFRSSGISLSVDLDLLLSAEKQNPEFKKMQFLSSLWIEDLNFLDKLFKSFSDPGDIRVQALQNVTATNPVFSEIIDSVRYLTNYVHQVYIFRSICLGMLMKLNFKSCLMMSPSV